MTLLPSMTALLAAALITVPLFKRLGLGSVLGYLAAGMVLGPTGFDLFGHPEEIMHFAEFGVVLLLFLIGLELDPERLWSMRTAVFGVGTAQVVLTGLIIGVALLAMGLDVRVAGVVGSALALSSTAFALQLLRERRELAVDHGRMGFSVLLFQDLAVIPMLAMLSFLAPAGDPNPAPWWQSLLMVVGGIGGLVLAGRFLLRPVFRIVASTGIPELSVALALFVVVGTALLMTEIGLSMALGAFLAGLLLANSEYRHELESHLAPFEGLLLGLFFMSVGMTADVRTALQEPGLLLSATAGLLLVKFGVLYGLGRLSGLSNLSSQRLGLTLSQSGEFAFVLFSVATTEGVIPEAIEDRALVVVTLSMVATPLLLALHDRLTASADEDASPEDYQYTGYDDNPVIIAGFGRYGQMVGRTLQMMHIPFTAIDIDPIHIDFVRRFGNRVDYGDAGRAELLRAAKAESARIIVIAVDDPEASVAIAKMVRRTFPHLKILARARNRPNAFALIEAG
ncbi:MAG: monovalent cation:proton antiporter-2 (CPA2) family protein, partial [Myxococcota bacterium]